jgi:hypothetical protein
MANQTVVLVYLLLLSYFRQDLNTFNDGSTTALFNGSVRGPPKPDRYDSIDRYERYNPYNRSLDLTDDSVNKFGLEESSDWNDVPRTYSYSNKDSGLVSLKSLL